MSQIPIKFQPVTITKAIKALDINQLISIICQYVTGSIDVDNVSFFRSGETTPTSNVGLFYNTTSQQFLVFDAANGGYNPMNDNQVGDVRYSYNTSDFISEGWVVLNGRSIDGVSPLSANQKTNLKVFFPGGTLPIVNSGSMVGKIFAGYP